MQRKELDITDVQLKGKELIDDIENKVYETQRYAVGFLPDYLILTKKQFEDLATQLKLPNMWDTEDRMYITKYNVMEVVIRDER